ncbi:MAG: hypothetical protein QOH28_3823 [Actinomycetota bacterium]|jgi:uncharacterized membrane protein YkoI|nr:hypothetical protein [Actinomycetota bacterium]
MQSELTTEPAPGEATPGSRPTAKRGRTLLIVSAAAVGAAIGGAGIASAATTGSSSTTAASSAASSGTPAADPAALSHGPGETLLTGTTAAKVKAAALAAVPGATIIRVETDSAGSPYEAHVTKADGTQVTLKVDASFKVTSTEQGFGGGPHGQAPPGGAAPSA